MKTARRVLTLLVALAVSAGGWWGIATYLRPSGDEEIYFVMKGTRTQLEFWDIVRAGVAAAATELGVEPIEVGPEHEHEVERQITILDGVIARRPDGILLVASAFDRVVPSAEAASAMGIPIVTLDSALNSSAPVSFVATDNTAAGRMAGDEIDRLVPPDGRIALVSHVPGVATAIDREAGIRHALAERDPRYLLPTRYSQNDPLRAYEIVMTLLSEYPDLAGIVGLNEYSSLGAARALRDAEAYQRVHMVGFDNNREEIALLEKGVIKALVVQKPFNMGYVGLHTLVHAIRGVEVAPVIHTDAVLIRKETIFTEENQRLLFPLIQGR